MPSELPPMPDFKAIEAAAPGSADRRTLILALIGNLVFSWSNNESLFIYVLMLLLETDQASAAVVFATLNTTRARLDLIHRLAKLKIRDPAMEKALDRISSASTTARGCATSSTTACTPSAVMAKLRTRIPSGSSKPRTSCGWVTSGRWMIPG